MQVSLRNVLESYRESRNDPTVKRYSVQEQLETGTHNALSYRQLIEELQNDFEDVHAI